MKVWPIIIILALALPSSSASAAKHECLPIWRRVAETLRILSRTASAQTPIHLETQAVPAVAVQPPPPQPPDPRLHLLPEGVALSLGYRDQIERTTFLGSGSSKEGKPTYEIRLTHQVKMRSESTDPDLQRTLHDLGSDVTGNLVLTAYEGKWEAGYLSYSFDPATKTLSIGKGKSYDKDSGVFTVLLRELLRKYAGEASHLVTEFHAQGPDITNGEKYWEVRESGKSAREAFFETPAGKARKRLMPGLIDGDFEIKEGELEVDPDDPAPRWKRGFPQPVYIKHRLYPLTEDQ